RAQDRCSFGRVLIGVWMDLPVEVVEEAGQSPGVRIAAKTWRVEPHRGLDGQAVIDQSFTLDVLSKERERLLTIHDAPALTVAQILVAARIISADGCRSSPLLPARKRAIVDGRERVVEVGDRL